MMRSFPSSLNYANKEDPVTFMKNLFLSSGILQKDLMNQLSLSLKGERQLEIYSSNMFCFEYVLEQ